MHIIFNIEGGIGKSVAATGVCRAIKKEYPEAKLVVVSAYPDVFLNNPQVHRCYQAGNLPYFYEDYIAQKDFIFLGHNPYLETSYIKEEKHLLQVWCELFSIPYNGELPELYLNQRELTYCQRKYRFNKPVLLLQTNGGAANQPVKYSWARDLPSGVVTSVINRYRNLYDIVHIRRGDQPAYPHTHPVEAPFREIACLATLSEKRLLIDSFMQHACAALGLQSTVCWIANNPAVLGYNVHDNICANPFTKEPELKHSFLNRFNITGNLLEFPYNSEDEIFNTDTIIASLENRNIGKDILSEQPAPLREYAVAEHNGTKP